MPPTMLIDSLHGLRRRVKWLGVAYGVGVALACAVALLLAVVLLDWVLALPRIARIVVDLLAVGALGYALVRWVARPALSKLSLGDLAGRLEHAFPQFDDRLRSTVNFVHDAEPHGSQVMRQRTIDDATQMAADVNLKTAVILRPVWYSLATGLGAVALFVLLACVVDPTFRRIAANHLLGGAEPWPKNVEIDMLGEMPQRVAVGQHVDVRMHLKKGAVKQAIIKYRYDTGPWQQEVMDKSADGVYSASLEARIDGNREQGKLQIKLQAGDDDREMAVVVVPRLDVRGVEALVTPPPYAHLPAAPVNLSERPVVTAIGSDISLNVSFNKALNTSKGVKIDPTDKGRKLPEIQWTFPKDGLAVAHFVAGETFKPNDPLRFTIHATDADNFENVASQEYQIIVREDALPTVQIEEPRRNEERTSDATIPLKAVAEDDYGIESAQLVVTRMNEKANNPGGSAKPWVINLFDKGVVAPGATWTPTESSTERKRFRLEYAWELAKLEGANLKPGDVLEFFVQVKDNYNLAGSEHPPVASGKLHVTIISHEQWDTIVEQTLAQTKQEIATVKKGQDVTKAETQAQSEETATKQKLDDAQRATLGRLATQQSTAAAQSKQTQQKLDELVAKMNENKSPDKGMKQIAKDVAKSMEQTSEGPMKQATSDLNQAKETKSDPKASDAQKKQDAQKAADAMNKATKNQQQASDQLQQAMDKLADFGGLSEAAAQIQKIKDEQEKLDKEYKEQMKEALGKKPEEMTPKEKADVKQMTDKQDQLSKQTDKALNDMSAKADKLTKMDPSASKAMKEASQTGKSQGIPTKQSDASQSMQQNQQSNAQNQQKQVELGLEMVLAKLREAERRKLEELQKELETVQKQVEELIARQAGHNIDNLFLQDPKKLSALSLDERTALLEQAQRKPEDLPKADVTVLTPSQEQTERNTRDVAKRAEGLPDPTAATKLTAAAGKMEQAIVFLRKALVAQQNDDMKLRLADAYTPPQVEALKNLLEAKKAVDDAKKKVDDQMRQENEETIKQAYVKLLEQQKKLDGETKDIDATPRDNDGNLPFLVGRRLGQLPGEQGDLSQKAVELGKKLEGLGSVVYVWANKDIVTSMGEVKDELAKPSTGVPTQAEQKRIEEQLDAMIKNLAQKNNESRFAQKGGGGGGGGGGKKPPKMPTDVELRLMRDLQLAINKNTGVLNGEKEKDAHKLLSLGGRQGEIRNLLDQVIQKASNGQAKLSAEPDNKDQLPEEANKEDIEEQEFKKGLLDDNLQADPVEQSVKLTGDRMARSRQRLAINNDPGKVTQEIQKRIVIDLEDMIKLAQKQQASGKGQGQQGQAQGQKPGEAKPGQGGQQQAKGNGQPQKSKDHNEGGNTPAGDSSLTQGNDPNVDVSKELKEKYSEWGGITKRDRQAVMEGASEKLVHSRYQKLVDDYYRDLAKKASER